MASASTPQGPPLQDEARVIGADTCEKGGRPTASEHGPCPLPPPEGAIAGPQQRLPVPNNRIFSLTVRLMASWAGFKITCGSYTRALFSSVRKSRTASVQAWAHSVFTLILACPNRIARWI